MSDVAQLHDHAFPFPELMPIDHADVQATAIRHDTIPVAMDRRADQEHEGVGYPRPDKVGSCTISCSSSLRSATEASKGTSSKFVPKGIGKSLITGKRS